MRRLIVILLLAGCYSPRGTRCEPCSGITECPGGLACISGSCQEAFGACEARDDSGTEAMPPGEPVACFGGQTPPYFEVCPPMIAPPFTLPATIDTVNDCTYIATATMNGPTVCVIAAERIVNGGSATRVIGERPLVLYGRDQIVLASELDLAGSSMDAVSAPPAGDANHCKEAGGLDGASGAGGAGATFRARGGNGAAGNGVAASPSSTVQATAGMTLRGGCRGGDGGKSTQNDLPGGLGGNGGGAIYILSPQISIAGRINASGGGARGGSLGGGGGGGGSGGMILLWSPNTITLGSGATIFALGGGGGSGGGIAAGLPLPGDDPGGPGDPATETTAASMSNGGTGGPGGSSSAFPGGMGIAGTTGGGGGGGGSTGFIFVHPHRLGPEFGPPPS